MFSSLRLTPFLSTLQYHLWPNSMMDMCWPRFWVRCTLLYLPNPIHYLVGKLLRLYQSLCVFACVYISTEGALVQLDIAILWILLTMVFISVDIDPYYFRSTGLQGQEESSPPEGHWVFRFHKRG